MVHFLSVDDVTKEEINKIFDIADDLSDSKSPIKLSDGSVLALLFEKASTRTRVSFEAAMAQLGGSSIYIDTKTSQMARGETIGDTARVLSSYVNFIAARMYNHDDLVELANYSSVPVINALTDVEHPCQALSDLYTVKAAKKKLRGIRIAFVGDIANNVANSLLLAGAKTGAEMILIGPKGYHPDPKYLTKAKEYGPVDVFTDMKEGLSDVDVIYTDTYVSMGQEAEAEKRHKLFAPYQINEKAVDYAKDDVSVMHCLPAHRGEEITSEVLDGPRSIAWEQAKNKMLVEKAIILHLSEQEL